MRFSQIWLPNWEQLHIVWLQLSKNFGSLPEILTAKKKGGANWQTLNDWTMVAGFECRNTEFSFGCGGSWFCSKLIFWRNFFSKEKRRKNDKVQHFAQIWQPFCFMVSGQFQMLAIECRPLFPNGTGLPGSLKITLDPQIKLKNLERENTFNDMPVLAWALLFRTCTQFHHFPWNLLGPEKWVKKKNTQTPPYILILEVPNSLKGSWIALKRPYIAFKSTFGSSLGHSRPYMGISGPFEVILGFLPF